MLPYFYFIEILLFATTIFLSVVYAILLYRIMGGWDDSEEWKVPRQYIPRTKISIVLAARNEEKTIGPCIESILNCNYPQELLEVIVVNDHSEDKTSDVVNNLDKNRTKLINLTASHGKKAALEVGIKQATGELIGCTDADCLVQKDWLVSFASIYEAKHLKCIAGPISYRSNDSLLQRFQYLDALNNMCVTANGIKRKSYYMANGANLFFRKSAFEEVGGHRSDSNLASGDDMFLIQKIADKYPNEISFLKSKNAIVKTEPEKSLKALVSQRTRWATKSKAYTNKNITKIQGFVFVFVLLIFLNLILTASGSKLCLLAFLLALLIKWTTDYLYLSKMANYFGNKKPLNSFFGASFGFFIYILFAGWKAIWPTNYTWKGRQTK